MKDNDQHRPLTNAELWDRGRARICLMRAIREQSRFWRFYGKVGDPGYGDEFTPDEVLAKAALYYAVSNRDREIILGIICTSFPNMCMKKVLGYSHIRRKDVNVGQETMEVQQPLYGTRAEAINILLPGVGMVHHLFTNIIYSCPKGPLAHNETEGFQKPLDPWWFRNLDKEENKVRIRCSSAVFDCDGYMLLLLNKQREPCRWLCTTDRP